MTEHVRVAPVRKDEPEGFEPRPQPEGPAAWIAVGFVSARIAGLAALIVVGFVSARFAGRFLGW